MVFSNVDSYPGKRQAPYPGMIIGYLRNGRPIRLIAGGSGASFDSVGPSASGAGNQTATVTWTHTAVAGNATILAGVVAQSGPDTGATTAVTCDGSPMTQVGGFIHTGDSIGGYLCVFEATGLSAGDHTIVATTTGGSNDGISGGSIAIVGATGLGTPATATGTSSPATVTTGATDTHSIVVGFVANTSTITSATSPSTSRFSAYCGNENDYAGYSAGATSPGTGVGVTMAWTVSGADWAVLAVEVLGFIDLSVTTTSLPVAYQGTSYSTALSAIGGSGSGYTWSLYSGSLPEWAYLDSDGTISGVAPGTSESTTFTVEVTDSDSNTATQSLTLNVVPQQSASLSSAIPGIACVGFVPGSAISYAASGSTDANVSTTVLSAVSSIGSTTITTSVNATPGVVAGTTAIVAATVTIAATATPSVVSGATSVGTTDISTTATATPSVVAGTASIPGPTFTSSVAISPTVVSGSTGIPVLTVTAESNATAVPSVVNGTTSMGSTTITDESNATATPGVVNGISAIPEPTVTAVSTASVSATAVAATTAIAGPTIVAVTTAEISGAIVSGSTSVPSVTITAVSTASVDAVTVEGSSELTIPTITAVSNASVTATAVAATSSILTPAVISVSTSTVSGYVTTGGSTAIAGTWSTLSNAEGSSTGDYASGVGEL